MPTFQLSFCSHHEGKKDKENKTKKFENCFLSLFCPDDDCRKTVETSVYLLLSILSGDNDLFENNYTPIRELNEEIILCILEITIFTCSF